MVGARYAHLPASIAAYGALGIRHCQYVVIAEPDGDEPCRIGLVRIDSLRALHPVPVFVKPAVKHVEIIGMGAGKYQGRPGCAYLHMACLISFYGAVRAGYKLQVKPFAFCLLKIRK